MRTIMVEPHIQMPPGQAVAGPGSFEGTPQQLAQLIYDQLVTYPETYDQNHWVYQWNDCGTTMCVAGWAQWFIEGRVNPITVAVVAGDKLGLTPEGRNELFWPMAGRDFVLESLKALANGEQPSWREVPEWLAARLRAATLEEES